MLNRNLTTQLEKRSDYWNGIEAPGPGSCIGLADGIRRHGVLATAFRSSFSAAEEVFEAAHVVHVGHAAFTTAHFSHEATESTHASAASSAHVTHAAELLHHVLHFAFGLHHFLHLAELLKELVDLQDGGSGTGGDALALGGFDDDWLGAFTLGHGEHDGFHLLDATTVERSGGELFFDLTKSGEHAEESFERTEALDHFHLIKEVVKVELAGLHPLGGGHGFLFVDLVGDLFHHADDVAHPEDAVGHSVGMEFGEVFHFLTFTNIFDGLAGDGTHGEGGATAGITIELGEDEAIDPDFLIEGLGDGDGLLTGGGVGDEKSLAGFEEFVEVLEFGEEGIVEFLATGGVEDDDGVILVPGPLDGFLGDFDEVGVSGIGKEAGDSDLLGKFGELVDGCGTVEVECHQEGATSFFFEAKSKFGGGGGFTGTVEAAEKDVTRRVEIDGRLVAAEEFGEFVLENFNDLFAWFHGLEDLGSLGLDADVGDKLFDDSEFDICLKKRETNFAQGVGDVFFGDFSDTPEVPEGFVEAVSEI
jgi:hypothetical protein